MPGNEKIQTAPTPPTRSPLLRELLIAAIIFILALLLRAPALGQSLWYDEMVTLVAYVGQPWSSIVKGQYSPNNHILFSLLAKLVTPETGDIANLTILVRLPSLIAGSLVPIALAWPLRRCCPKLALGIALVAALHPWLITLSTWARGYALLLLLSILATNLLPKRKQILSLPYALLSTAALYTQPLAILLIAAHGATILFLRRNLFMTWFRSALLTGLLTFLLYLPFLHDARHYWSKPEQPSTPYTEFIFDSLRYTQQGGDLGGTPPIAVTLLILTAGSFAAWQNPHLRPQLLTFLFVSLLGFIVPLIIPLAGEVRAMLWLIPLYCICSVTLIGQSLRSPAPLRWLGAAAFLTLLGSELFADRWIATTPSQPIRDTLAITKKLAEKGHPIIGIYMGAREGGILYGGIHFFAYQLDPDSPPHPDSLPSLKTAESRITQIKNAKTPYAVVFFDHFLKRDQPELWNYLQQNYEPTRHLEGRLSPATIYLRNSLPMPATQPMIK
ncbi:MAG TPA: hypothetical protein VGQ99_10675 [Tepidisphaeraceae bacterium]|jgi:hypothetical protein|nr:hypothetical protein [Tepidisphaeraceae bacterium]